MFWGSGSGVNSMEYTHMLQHDLFPELRELFKAAGKKKFYLQQDGASIHTSKATQYLLDKEGVETFKWPPNSPDLNIIENLWAIVSRRLEKRTLSSFDEFKNALREEWAAVSLDEIRNLFHSIDRRLKLVVELDGMPTPY